MCRRTYNNIDVFEASAWYRYTSRIILHVHVSVDLGYIDGMGKGDILHIYITCLKSTVTVLWYFAGVQWSSWSYNDLLSYEGRGQWAGPELLPQTGLPGSPQRHSTERERNSYKRCDSVCSCIHMYMYVYNGTVLLYMCLLSFPFDVVSGLMYTGMLKPLIFDQNEQEYHSTLNFWGNPCICGTCSYDRNREMTVNVMKDTCV